MPPITIRAWVTLLGELRLTVSPVAPDDAGRWHALLARLPSVRSISREDADGRAITFSLGDAQMMAVLMQLRRVAVFDGNETGYAATGEVIVRLRWVNLPAPAARPVAKATGAQVSQPTPVQPIAPLPPPAEAVTRDIAARLAEREPAPPPRTRQAGGLRAAFPRLRPMPATPSRPPR